MRVRLLFTKMGPLRFVGHLDLMRFLQKAFRRSGLPLAYSQGYHPHLLLTFAAPLGIGLQGEGEIMDVELACRDPFPLSVQEEERLRTLALDNENMPPAPSSAEICDRMNAVLPQDIRVLDARRMSGLAPKAMASLFSSDYDLLLRGLPWSEEYKEQCARFLAREEILITKGNAEEENEKNIRHLIHSLAIEEAPTGCLMRCHIAQGSTANLRPEQMLGAFAKAAGFSLDELDLMMTRKSLYDREGRMLIEEGELLHA